MTLKSAFLTNKVVRMSKMMSATRSLKKANPDLSHQHIFRDQSLVLLPHRMIKSNGRVRQLFGTLEETP